MIKTLADYLKEKGQPWDEVGPLAGIPVIEPRYGPFLPYILGAPIPPVPEHPTFDRSLTAAKFRRLRPPDVSFPMPTNLHGKN